MNPVTCPRCKAILPVEALNSAALTRCRVCTAEVQAVVFPALVRGPGTGQVGETLLTENDSNCFYHPRKRATGVCEHCGRFLCALCDVDLNGQHLCPSCVESGTQKGRLQKLQQQRVLYDSMALGLAILPVLFWPLTILSSPAALFVAIRYWKAPTSILPRTKIRFILAILIAGAQVAGWTTGIVYLLTR